VDGRFFIGGISDGKKEEFGRSLNFEILDDFGRPEDFEMVDTPNVFGNSIIMRGFRGCERTI